MSDAVNSDDLVLRGEAAARAGRRSEAREMLRRAVKLSPGSVRAWLALAGVEEEPSEKIRCFEAALKLDPRNVEARLGLEMVEAGPREPAPGGLSADDELTAVIAEASRQLEAAVGPSPAGEVPGDDLVYCANHPTVQTMLRCNRCGKPICTRCAVRTPVGYRCRQCVGQQQAAFYTGGTLDYLLGGSIALVLGGLVGFLMTMLGSGAWFFGLILGPSVGIGIAELVRLAVRRRRSRYLWLSVTVGILVGALPAILVGLIGLNPFRLLAPGLFLVLCIGAAAARLR